MRHFTIFIIAFILHLYLSVNAQSPPNIDSTKTLDSTTLNSIYYGLYNDPFLIELQQHLSSTDNEASENIEGVESTSFGFKNYALRTFEFVFGIITEYRWDIQTNTKSDIKDFPVSDTIKHYFNNPNNANNDNQSARALSLCSLLRHYTDVCDFLYYYSDTAYVNSILDSLGILACYADSVLKVSEPLGEPPDSTWPKPSYANIRLRLIGALGYAGLILDNSNYVQYADDQLFIYSHPDYPFNGYLNFQSGNSGAFKEGPGYMAFSMHGLTPYFTARKRLTGINYFDDL